MIHIIHALYYILVFDWMYHNRTQDFDDSWWLHWILKWLKHISFVWLLEVSFPLSAFRIEHLFMTCGGKAVYKVKIRKFITIRFLRELNRWCKMKHQGCVCPGNIWESTEFTMHQNFSLERVHSLVAKGILYNLQQTDSSCFVEKQV